MSTPRPASAPACRPGNTMGMESRPATFRLSQMIGLPELAIGIHTNGGCNSDDSGANSGTSFEVDALENAINGFPGLGTRYADAYHPLLVSEEGTLFRPYSTLQPAVDNTPDNGVCSIFIGVYALPSGTRLRRPMRLLAPSGGVFILGN